LASTEATAGSLLVQVTETLTSADVPSLKCLKARSERVEPGRSSSWPGVTERLRSVTGTLTVTLAASPESVAVITAVPGPRARTVPLVMDATPGALVDHTAVALTFLDVPST
jgi:hypothetical protein